MANDIGKNPVGSTQVLNPVEAATRARATTNTTGRLESAAKSMQEKPQVSGAGESLNEVVSGLNEMVQNLHRNLHFSVDDHSGDTVIKVIDSQTDEVVRQIPSEEIMKLRQRMKDAAGALFQGAV